MFQRIAPHRKARGSLLFSPFPTLHLEQRLFMYIHMYICIMQIFVCKFTYWRIFGDFSQLYRRGLDIGHVWGNNKSQLRRIKIIIKGTRE